MDTENCRTYWAFQVVPAPLFMAFPVVLRIELLSTEAARKVLDTVVTVHVGVEVDTLVKGLPTHSTDEVLVTFVHFLMAVPLTEKLSVSIKMMHYTKSK